MASRPCMKLGLGPKRLFRTVAHLGRWTICPPMSYVGNLPTYVGWQWSGAVSGILSHQVEFSETNKERKRAEVDWDK